MAIRRRTRARELALQHLYSVDVSKEPESPSLDEFLRMQSGDEATRAFAAALVRGVLTEREAIDAAIRRAATRWDLKRIAVVDRNILRLGAHELMHRRDIPFQVTLNEMIELAKKFSTQKSGAFVNGILDRIRGEAGRRPGETPAPAAAVPEPDGELPDEPPEAEAAAH